MADCPTTEILAEYLEGGLPPERRLRLEEHLAGCPDCCTSFAQATIFLLEEELGRMPVAPSVPYPLVQIAGSKAAGLGIVLAATGALLWSFHVGSDARREVSAEPPSRPVVVASAAVVDYGAPRLTGGRRWAAFAPAAPVVGELRRGFVDAATPAGVGYRPASQEAGGAGSRLPLAADGAAELLAGEADAAVAALLRAAAIEPDSAELRSDLGAALLARARQGDEAEDSPAALEAIETALAESPRLPEALFNRALALEQLHLPVSARQAWRAYLDVDEGSHWAEEARRRLAAGDSSSLEQYLLGEAFGYMGQSSRGWSHLLPAVAAAPRLIDHDRASSILLATAIVALLEDRPRTAAAILDEVLAGGLEAPHLQVQAYLSRCRIRIAIGDPTGARADLQRAAAWAARVDAIDRRQLSGDLQAAEGMLARQPAQAVAAFSRALVSFERSDRTLRMPGVLLERARAHRRAGDVAAADADLRRGLDLIDAQSPSVRGEAIAATRREVPEQLADERIELALAAGRGDRAFELAEEQRTRALRSLGSKDARAESAVSLAGLQRRVGAGTTMLFYSVLEDRVVLWRITDASARLVPLQVRPVELGQWITALRTDLAAGAWTSGTRRVAQKLYASLLAPAHLDEGALVVVPDKDLHSLPFAALVDPATGRFLIEERELSVAPSAALYTRGRDRWRELAQAPPQSAVVVGDPMVDPVLFAGLHPLPGAREEARRIAALYPQHQLLVGGAATRSALLAATPRGEVLHFAGHAALNRMAPERSSLPLATVSGVGEGALAASEIGALRLARTRTVVLSTCDGAVGARPPGEGPISLTRAFLHAGAPSVVASLWAVADGPTAPLIARVHQQLRAGEKAATALRAAQLDALRSREPSLRSPAVWAAFESFGG